MIVACDADGITCDLHVEWLRRYNRDYDDTFSYEKWTKWNVHELVKPECGKKIYDYLRDPDLYDYVQPVEGSLDGVAAIREMGHEVFFVTANAFGMTDQKARWFIRHGFCKDSGNMLPADYVPMLNKNYLDAYLLIDDGGHNVRDWIEKRSRPAIMLDRPWNAHMLDDVHSAFWMRCFRARDWKGIVYHVEHMSKILTV